MRALVVEDDPDELKAIVSELKGCGFEVLTAQTLVEAQAALLRHAFEFRLVSLDVCFPRDVGEPALETMGPILLDWIRARHPSLYVIINTATGEGHEDGVTYMRESRFNHFVKKGSKRKQDKLKVVVPLILAEPWHPPPSTSLPERRRAVTDLTEHTLVLVGDLVREQRRTLFLAMVDGHELAVQKLHFKALWVLVQGLRAGSHVWVTREALDGDGPSAISKLRGTLARAPYFAEDLIQLGGRRYRLTCRPENVTEHPELAANLDRYFKGFLEASRKSRHFPGSARR